MGFPGWHIECTAMSTKYLGETFDIHTGGEDHIAVHHTNEIAQSFGAFGHNTAKFWMHNAFITFKGEKISKSSGGLFTVKDLIDMGFDPMAFRYMILGSHYRKGIEFSLENLKSAENAYNRLLVLWFEWRSSKNTQSGIVDESFKKEFIEKINDDLAMPEALAVVWKMVRSEINNANKLATLIEFNKILGLNLGVDSREEKIPEEILKLVEERKEARNNKNWAESDRLREVIKNKGYLVEDLQNQCTIRPIT
jgi:cysteinyl-tRNA synthetase